MKMKLSQKFVDRDLRCPDGRKQIEYCDTDLPGLYVLVSAVSPGKGTYHLRYKNESGKTCHRKIGRTADVDLKEARNRAKALKLEISQGRDPQAEVKRKRNEMTFAEYFEEVFLPYSEARHRNAKRYRSLYDTQLKRAFGDVKMSAITRRTVQEFHGGLRAKGYSNAYCNRYLQLIKSSFNTAINVLEIVDVKNPAVGVPLFEEHGRERYLDEEELSRLLPVLAAEDGVTARIIRFLLATGLRLGECLNAKWSDVDVDNRVMTIPAVRAKSKKTDSIPLNAAAIRVLEECDRDADWPFANPNTGKPYVCIKKSFRSLMKKAGLEGVTAHTLRHTAASIMINSGRSLYDVQRVLRHSSSQVTEKYAHLSPKSARAACDAISDSLMKVSGGG